MFDSVDAATSFDGADADADAGVNICAVRAAVVIVGGISGLLVVDAIGGDCIIFDDILSVAVAAGSDNVNTGVRPPSYSSIKRV